MLLSQMTLWSVILYILKLEIHSILWILIFQMFLKRIIEPILWLLLLALLVFEKHSPSVTEVPSSSGEAAVTHCGTRGWYPPLKGILSSHEQNEKKGQESTFLVSLILGAFTVSWMPDFNHTATTNTSIYSERCGFQEADISNFQLGL